MSRPTDPATTPSSSNSEGRSLKLAKDRRAAHEGTLEELPSGKFRYRTKINGVRVSGPSSTSKREAWRLFQQKIREHNQSLTGKKEKPAVPTVADYIYATLDGPYRERLRTGGMSPKTWILYEHIYRLNVENDPLGAMPIDEVSYTDIEGWIRALKTQPETRVRLEPGSGRTKVKVYYKTPAEPLSPNSKTRYAGFLSGVFERARLEGLIAHNPVRDAEKPEYEEPEFRILDAKEERELIALAHEWQKANYDERPNFAAYHKEGAENRAALIVLLGLHGLGAAEMAGLRKSDFTGDGFHVRRQARLGEVVDKLKTKNRKAWVAMAEDLAQLVEKCRDDYLLPTKTGRPMSENNIRRLFAGIVAGTKFEGMTPYHLRHTFAMRLLEEGVDVRTVAELMRNTPEVVLRRYVRSRDELKKSAVGKLSKSRITHDITHEAG